MSGLTARMKDAIREGCPLALLCEIDHPDGYVRVWSHTGTLHHSGHDWQGLGILGRVSPGSKSNTLGIKQVTFELSGVPPTSTQFLSSRVRNREAQVWLAAIKNGAIVRDPYLMIWSKLDYQMLKLEDNGMARIQIVGNVGFWNIERATNIAWTHETQIATYAADVGLALLPELTDKESNWRLS